MNKIIITIIVFMCATPLFAGSTPQEDETEAAKTYITSDSNTPRAGYARESENFAVWHTIEELLARDKAEREAGQFRIE